ncbi:shikimate kinase [Streptococcus ictaluri]|uniref:Shikimate kinase n=1 Tax=Streptococcus ictaluri 707-05 TaxID=764299 RepID=G5K646_9STRE|nr:shikimate kinase [Streptococcus ictaluri]EHI68679.1 shikimate kinase [Streptococcus ictaluri 707-05]
MAIFLLGFMGCGKSSVLECFDQDGLDMDQLLEDRLGMTIRDYFTQYGEAAFRKEERKLLEELIAIKEPIYVATGGGIVMSPENRLVLKTNKAHNIYLSAPFEVLYNRITQDSNSPRPLVVRYSQEELRELFNHRIPFYQEVAGRTISVGNRSPKEIAALIENT